MESREGVVFAPAVGFEVRPDEINLNPGALETREGGAFSSAFFRPAQKRWFSGSLTEFCAEPMPTALLIEDDAKAVALRASRASWLETIEAEDGAAESGLRANTFDRL
jgi:hypothetical protein